MRTAKPDVHDGAEFDRLTVLYRSLNKRGGKWLWRCRCRCGAETAVRVDHLRSGRTRSCGCLMKEVNSDRAATHRMTGSPEHVTWLNMKNRCSENHPQREDYGRRGIEVCEKWQDDFLAFLADVGPKPSPEHTLDRIENDGNYEPGNVRWATRTTQSRNTRTRKTIEHDGESLTIAEWAEKIGIRRETLWWRLKQGWTIRRALETPGRDRQQQGGQAADQPAEDRRA